MVVKVRSDGIRRAIQRSGIATNRSCKSPMRLFVLAYHTILSHSLTGAPITIIMISVKYQSVLRIVQEHVGVTDYIDIIYDIHPLYRYICGWMQQWTHCSFLSHFSPCHAFVAIFSSCSCHPFTVWLAEISACEFRAPIKPYPQHRSQMSFYLAISQSLCKD